MDAPKDQAKKVTCHTSQLGARMSNLCNYWVFSLYTSISFLDLKTKVQSVVCISSQEGDSIILPYWMLEWLNVP